MIITRTPFRISFVGGGTDYPVWFRQHGGAVLATTINKYCYLSCRYLPPFFEHKTRVVWSQIEEVQDRGEIRHPAVREVLKWLDIRDGVEIHHVGDLPARTGLGSSSSFTVGLLHALYALKGIMANKRKLAVDAIHIEQERLRESVGSQDQISAAFGGFNRIDFDAEGNFRVSPLVMAKGRLELLQQHLMIFFTGISRTASEIAAAQIKATQSKERELKAMSQSVDEAMRILVGGGDLSAFGELLHDNWLLKKSLTDRVTTPRIDAIYEVACRAGATGGKLLGAGGGGFILFFVGLERQIRVKEALKDLLHIPFRFEPHGSQIILYEPSTAESSAQPVADLEKEAALSSESV